MSEVGFLWAPVWVYVGVFVVGALVNVWWAARDCHAGDRGEAGVGFGMALISAVLAVVIAAGGW